MIQSTRHDWYELKKQQVEWLFLARRVKMLLHWKIFVILRMQPQNLQTFCILEYVFKFY